MGVVILSRDIQLCLSFIINNYLIYICVCVYVHAREWGHILPFSHSLCVNSSTTVERVFMARPSGYLVDLRDQLCGI